MQRVLSILFGAGFTVTTAWAAGTLLLRRLRVDLDPLETLLFSFLSGAACLSVVVFLLCAMHEARPAVLLALGVGVIPFACFRPARAGKQLP